MLRNFLNFVSDVWRSTSSISSTSLDDMSRRKPPHKEGGGSRNAAGGRPLPRSGTLPPRPAVVAYDEQRQRPVAHSASQAVAVRVGLPRGRPPAIPLRRRDTSVSGQANLHSQRRSSPNVHDAAQPRWHGTLHATQAKPEEGSELTTTTPAWDVPVSELVARGASSFAPSPLKLKRLSLRSASHSPGATPTPKQSGVPGDVECPRVAASPFAPPPRTPFDRTTGAPTDRLSFALSGQKRSRSCNIVDAAGCRDVPRSTSTSEFVTVPSGVGAIRRFSSGGAPDTPVDHSTTLLLPVNAMVAQGILRARVEQKARRVQELLRESERYAVSQAVDQRGVELVASAGNAAAVAAPSSTRPNSAEPMSMLSKLRSRLRLRVPTERPSHVEDLQAIAKATDYDPARPSSERVVISNLGYSITNRHLATLLGTSWLNDQVINYYCTLLASEGGGAALDPKAKPAVPPPFASPTCATLGSFFYTQLLKEGPDAAERASKNFPIFGVDSVLIAINHSSHWTLLVQDNAKRCYRYYDSLHGKGFSEMRHIAEFMDTQFHRRRDALLALQEKLAAPRASGPGGGGEGPPVAALSKAERATLTMDMRPLAKEVLLSPDAKPPSQWQRIGSGPQCPKQQGVVDCGVFCAQFARCVAHGLPVSDAAIRQSDVADLRHVMLLELIAGHVARRLPRVRRERCEKSS